MNVVDSSAWIEHLRGTANAIPFREAIADGDSLILPTIILFEVCRVVRKAGGEADEDEAIALMTRGEVVELSSEIALAACGISIAHDLALADAIIYATANFYDATLWTQDAHFKDLPNVRYFPKPPARSST